MSEKFTEMAFISLISIEWNVTKKSSNILKDQDRKLAKINIVTFF